MLTVGNVINVECIDLNYLGKGVCKYLDFVIFVDDLIPLEVASIKINKIKKRYAFGSVIKLIETSKKRISKMSNLGSLDLSHIDHSLQLEWQTNITRHGFERLVGSNININEIITDNNIKSYRNKLVYHNILGDKHIKFGLYDINHNLVKVDSFDLAPNHVNELINDINSSKLNQIKELKHIVIRTNDKSEMLITLVITNKGVNLDLILSKLVKYKLIVGITVNINPNKYEILSNKSNLIYGKNEIEIKLGKLPFKISDTSFFQVNTNVAKLAIDVISNYVDKDKVIIDAYSGTGAIGFYLAHFSKFVYMIDNNNSNIVDASNYISNNNINNCATILGDATLEIEKLDANILIVDPPRKGLSDELIKTINEKNFDKVIYLSCNLNSLLQNVKELISNYDIKNIYPIRMFPQTTSVETLVVLEKK